MRNVLIRMWNDDCGIVFTLEILLVLVILALGLISGLAILRNAMVTELTESSNAILAISQAYSYSGLSNCAGSTAGAGTVDTSDLVLTVNSPPISVSVVNDPVCF